MAMTVGSASASTGLAGEIKAQLASRRLIQLKDDGYINDICDALASAVIAHLKTNMVLKGVKNDAADIPAPNAVA